MLSFIYNLVNNFESSHGIRPNLLHLNDSHLQHLIDGFSDDYDLVQIMDFLKLEIIIDREVIHPRVSWSRHLEKKVACC